MNHAKVYRSPLPAINVNGTLVHNDLVKANIFNSYFGSVFTDEDVSNLEGLRCSSIEHPLLIDTVEVSASEVYDQLRDLDPHRVCVYYSINFTGLVKIMSKMHIKLFRN